LLLNTYYYYLLVTLAIVFTHAACDTYRINLENKCACIHAAAAALNKDFMLMAYPLSYFCPLRAPRSGGGASIAGPILLAFKVETARCNG
jgi:hypothetical protein